MYDSSQNSLSEIEIEETKIYVDVYLIIQFWTSTNET